MSQTAVTPAPIGVPGDIADLHTARNGFMPAATSEEVSAEIPFGTMVRRGVGDRGVLKLSATNQILAGIAVRAHDFADSERGEIGLKPGATFALGVKGRFFVRIEQDVTPTSDVRVRAVVTGNEIAGIFRATADSTDCIEITPYARWVRTASAADGVAELDIDLTHVSLGTADV